MTNEELKATLKDALPQLVAEDPLIRDFILRTVSNYYANKQETEDRFDRLLNELERDRQYNQTRWEQAQAENNRRWEQNQQRWEENNRRWEQSEQRWEENNRRWEQNEQRWEENNRRWEQNEQRWDQNEQRWEGQYAQNQVLLSEIRQQNRRYDSTIGALGARWGLYTEASFRNALKAILIDSFEIEVLNINDIDEAGEVFGHPDQVEIDIIIRNGLIIACEIKSSMSKSDMYIFDRKVSFYQKHYQQTVNRKIVISPMVSDNARPVADLLSIEVYSYADQIQEL